MKAVILGHTTFVIPAGPRTILERRLRRWTTGLLLSAVAGVVVALNGLIISMASLIGLLARHGVLSTIGVILIALSFPLMFLSAHCLDRIDETRRAIWNEHYWETWRANGTLTDRLETLK